MTPAAWLVYSSARTFPAAVGVYPAVTHGKYSVLVRHYEVLHYFPHQAPENDTTLTIVQKNRHFGSASGGHSVSGRCPSGK